ncbi:MAG: HAD-IA family hydrolase [Natronospirillum sp.]|uniref:HAD family hydrolase n=1 Tax=Natronospirillum sp. TaxID=2812955 RepID=UPI0025E3197C|nr:HAD-IA family hydrolase [Natronospirillum sp.]MCH8551438.1 HAD-IA family hydrolase [Natronospirillum sp.]
MHWNTADALIFDMDGTLADSMPAHFEAWQVAAREFGFSFTAERFQQLGGVPTRQTLEILCREQQLDLPIETIAGVKEQAILGKLDHVLPLQPILDIARWWHHQGRPMAVATGASRTNAEITLRTIGADRWFSVVMTAEDVSAHKPAPDVFLKAALAIGAEPAQCAAFEDTDIGLQAIRAAGMQAWDVRQPIPVPPDNTALSD